MIQKILFIDHDANRSGATISMEYIINEFLNNRFDVYLLTRKNKKDSEIFSQKGVKVITYSKSTLLSIALSIHFSDDYPFLTKNWFLTNIKNLFRMVIGTITMFKVIKTIKPNLVYLNEHNLVCGSFVSYLLGIKAFMHIRSKFIVGKFGIREAIIAKSIIKFNSHVFVISKIEFAQLNKYNKDGKDNIEILPEFLNEKDFLFPEDFDKLRTSLAIPPNACIVLSFGGIDRLKGTYDYLRTILLINRNKNNLYFLLAGDFKEQGIMDNVSTYYKKTYTLLNELEKMDNFQVLGFLKNPKPFLALADILVSTLEYSHFSRPIIEAWALKKAIITSDTEHARSYVVENLDGLFYSIGDISQLAEKILKLSSDTPLYKKISENGYKKSRKHFLHESNLQKIISRLSL